MSAPEIPSGWEGLFSMEEERLTSQLAALAMTQQRHTSKISTGLVSEMYDLAQNRLPGYQFPALQLCQVLLYAKRSLLTGAEQGGGLQYNFWAGGPLGIRVQLYRISDEAPLVRPTAFADYDQAAEIADRIEKMQKAFELGMCDVEFDLTTVVGDASPPRIVEVPQPFDQS